jgi:hypothetical protein
MANRNQDNAAYLNFIENLNEILLDFDIGGLNCS